MTTEKHYPRVLSIAGSDSGGGAGIQADLKTFSALGCYGMTAITAITAQNTQGVRAIHGVPPDILAAQIDAVVEDIGADAVKIGMLHAPEVVRVVAQAIRRHGLQNVVLDPVMVATSGDKLTTPETVDVLVRELLALGAPAVLLKGGHLQGNEVVDVLLRPGAAPLRLASPRIASKNVHGTGCTLSSAIAAHLALGLELGEAVTRARSYILGAIAAGAGVRTGHGHGPLNHGHAPVAMHIMS